MAATINALNTKVNNRNRFVEFFTDSAAGGDSAGSRIVADSANDFVKFSGGTNLEVVVADSDNARTITFNHTSVGASSVDNSGNTVIQDLTIDANGHVTGTASTTITPANNAQHIMGAQGGMLVNTPGGVNFTANASTNITTNYSLDSDLRGNVKFAGQSGEYVHFSDSNGGQINFHNSGTRRFVMEDDGDFHAANDIIAFSTTPSDMRLKSDIEPITDALAKVNALTGYTFTYDHAGRKSAGLLAQEVEQVLPSAVSNKRLPLGANNNEEYKTLQYDQTIALLVESVKELKSEIDILKRDK